MTIRDRIIAYWKGRSGDFGALRMKELQSNLAPRWLREITPHIKDTHQRILDLGTGTGFFAFLLAQQGYSVTGIDLTEDMIAVAKAQAMELQDSLRGTVDFRCMDAMQLDFPDQSFDVILARNLTWTLPDVESAYKEWYRVLAPKGVLINIDGDYGVELKVPVVAHHHIHEGVANETMQECIAITEELSISRMDRPHWDVHMMRKAGFSRVYLDMAVSSRMYDEEDELYNPVPLFSIVARK